MALPGLWTPLSPAGADIEARTVYGYTPLHSAAAVRFAGLVGALVKVGADIEVRNWDGRTPLYFTAVSGDTGMVDALFNAGADPKVRTEGGQTPFDLAKKNEEIVGTDAYWRLNDARFR